MKDVTLKQCEKYLPMHSTTASTIDRDAERRKDHVGHFVLRLAFCRSWVFVYMCGSVVDVNLREDLRRRFVKAEMALFKIRYESDDSGERAQFLSSRAFDWIEVCVSTAPRYATN